MYIPAFGMEYLLPAVQAPELDTVKLFVTLAPGETFADTVLFLSEVKRIRC